MKNTLILFAALVSAVAVSSCASVQRSPQLSDAAVELVDAGCVLIEAVTDSTAVDKVCATATELAPFVKVILAKRARARASDAGAD